LLEEAIDRLSESDIAIKAILKLKLASIFSSAEPDQIRALAIEPGRIRTLAKDAILVARQLPKHKDQVEIFGRSFSALFSFAFSQDPRELNDVLKLGNECKQLAENLKDERPRANIAIDLSHLFMVRGDLHAVDAEVAALAILARTQWGVSEGKYVAYEVAGMKVARCLLCGPLGEAERLATEAFLLGQEAKFSHAFAMFQYQLLVIRAQEGRIAEGEPVAKAGLQQAGPPFEAHFRIVLTYVYAELGRLDEARDHFERVAANDFAAFGRASLWLMEAALLAQVANALGDSERARILYNLTLPYRSFNVSAGGAHVALGSAEAYLGLLATTMSHFDHAQRHFEAALEFNAKMGALPWVARTQYEYARMLRRRGLPGDRQRAFQLLGAAHETSQQLGMFGLSKRSAALIAELGN
jgi:tetratricopeptide (TPR) repeat protein